ncbi:hypothetical protein HY967_04385 [Candidatus Jorgensenbacteria bacterium]|nr:hypothetical protein [Candidatus Jorgensenbacteria bacterium]
MKLIVGLVGEIKAGKETTVRHIKKYLPKQFTFSHLRFSDTLAQTLDLWGAPKNRHNLQNLVVKMEEVLGEGALSRAMALRIQNDRANITVVDGIRWWSDVHMIKSFNPSVMVYITANRQERYIRTVRANDKVGDPKKTWEEFVVEDEAHNERFIGEIGRKAADYIIVNNGREEEFRDNIRQLFNEKIKSLLQAEQ